MKTFFESIGVKMPEVYLPNENVDLNKWSVVACDQYTSQPEYWEDVKNYVGDAPSTLNIVFPEVYLEDADKEQRIEKIKNTMLEYKNNGILENKGFGFIYLDRQTSQVRSRKGLVIALDLEKYDFNKGSQTLIRATEGTIVDRLPPRIKVRDGAEFELPHIMVLIDDPDKTVIEPIAQNLDKYKKLYDFDLMMEGGHVIGYQINDDESVNNIIRGLENLANPEVFKSKYNVGDDLGVLLFAMGDGNHSLATAKAIWEEKKKTLQPGEMLDHPARFALVEIVNVHDVGLTFEPIHRVMFDIDNDVFFDEMNKYFLSVGSELTVTYYDTKDELKENLKESTPDRHYCRGMNEKGYMILTINNPKLNLEVGNIQDFINKYLLDHTDARVDYVHGEEVTEELGRKRGNLGLLFPIMDKLDFFKTVVVDGALPRKTFSMGEAEEKRFYLEARKIVR